MVHAGRATRSDRLAAVALGGCLGAAALTLLLAGCDRRPAAGVLSPDLRSRTESRADDTAERYRVERIPPEGLEIDSDYSDIVIRDVGPMRALYFKRDDGSLVLQSRLSLAEPDRLLLQYQQTLFTSYLFVPAPSRMLIVGLGGGGMVRFLQRRDAGVAVDAVDIDPVVVDVARRYFGTTPSENVRLITADGYDFIRQSRERYDVIYMDVFLRPSDETDAAGAALRIKDAPFYAAMADHLTPQGVVAFNLLPHPQRDSDVAELRQAFPQVYVFEAKGELNWIAIATADPRRVELAELRERAAALDTRFAGSLSFADMVGRYQGGG
jgi:spermidine synthase